MDSSQCFQGNPASATTTNSLVFPYFLLLLRALLGGRKGRLEERKDTEEIQKTEGLPKHGSKEVQQWIEPTLVLAFLNFLKESICKICAFKNPRKAQTTTRSFTSREHGVVNHRQNPIWEEGQVPRAGCGLEGRKIDTNHAHRDRGFDRAHVTYFLGAKPRTPDTVSLRQSPSRRPCCLAARAASLPAIK